MLELPEPKSAVVFSVPIHPSVREAIPVSFLPGHSPMVAWVIWLWPSSVRRTSFIVSLPHLGQTISLLKVGRIPLSSIPIWPTLQSKVFRHFLHSKLIVIALYPFLLFTNVAPDGTGKPPNTAAFQCTSRGSLFEALRLMSFGTAWWKAPRLLRVLRSQGTPRRQPCRSHQNREQHLV